jgi:DNA-directed RNA polymerase alpha subunit
MNDRATDLNALWESQCDIKIRRVLSDNGVASLWDLVACTKRDLMKMVGIGSIYRYQIEQTLDKLGLALRREIK